MSLFSGLFEKARELLGKPRPAGTAKDAIAHGALEELVYDELLAEVPALRELADSLRVNYAGANDLVRDTWLTFYQASPELRAQREMSPSRLANWAAAKGLAESPETPQTREYTAGDKYGATMAAMGVTSKVKSLLDISAEADEKGQEAERAQQEQQAATDTLNEAMAGAAAAEEALEQAQAGGDAEAAAQAQAAAQAAAAALAQAVEVADYAAEAAEVSAVGAQQASTQAGKRMQALLSQAVEQAGKELAEESDLLQAWGLSDGEVEYYSFEERRKLIAALKASEVSRHLDLLGRFTFSERAMRATRVVPGRDEVYAIERSDRLEDTLISELTLLADEVTELEFMERFGNGQLLTRAYRGKEKAGKGAIVVCVDTSGSMKVGQKGYTPAAWSKAFALALLQRCKADKRDFVGVLFSSRNQVQVYRFTKGRAPIEDVLEFVGKQFNGGTNFEAPIDTALDILRREFDTEGRAKGDIVFITDDQCAVTQQWMTAYRKQKADLGFRFWGIACGKRIPGHTLEELSDNVRALTEFIDPTQVADLMKAI